MTYRIVDTDNFGSDYPNERFTQEGPFEDKAVAEARAEELNYLHWGDGAYAPRYYKVVELPYELQPGFEP